MVDAQSEVSRLKDLLQREVEAHQQTRAQLATLTKRYTTLAEAKKTPRNGRAGHRTPEATVDKLVIAVKAVLNYPFGGYWSFLGPCQDALAAYEGEIKCACGAAAQIKVVKGNQEKMVCPGCLVKSAEEDRRQLTRKER